MKRYDWYTTWLAVFLVLMTYWGAQVIQFTLDGQVILAEYAFFLTAVIAGFAIYCAVNRRRYM